MTQITERVGMPEDYFIKGVRQTYRNPSEALFRELLQNAVDAGANSVDFTLTDTQIIAEDDGCGMTPEILRSALLTLNGTYKRAGSVGGFGSAKEIILYAQKSYEIYSLDTLVQGAGLEYTLQPAAPRVGTRITIVPHAHYEYSKEKFLPIAANFLRSCGTIADITLNGETIKKRIFDREVKAFSWGRIFVKQMRLMTTEYAQVRVKGVHMFNHYVGTTKKQVLVEIDQPSTQILTSNRDGFCYGPAKVDFDKAMVDLAINKESFGIKSNKEVITGVTNYYALLKSNPDRLGTLTNLIANSEFAVDPLTMRAALASDDPNTVNRMVTEIIQSLHRQGNDQLAQQAAGVMTPAESEKAQIPVDFIIDTGPYTLATLPHYYHPHTMGARIKALTQQWREAIQQCLRIAFPDQQIFFRIGWTFNPDSEASFQRDKQGMFTFLLNPTLSHWKTGVRTYAGRLIATAMHEVVHSLGNTIARVIGDKKLILAVKTAALKQALPTEDNEVLAPTL